MLIIPLSRMRSCFSRQRHRKHARIHSCENTSTHAHSSEEKSFSDAANTTPPTPTHPTPPPNQAHDMVNVWQWRAIGNNHGKNKNNGSEPAERVCLNMQTTVPSPFAFPTPSKGSLLDPRYMNVKLKKKAHWLLTFSARTLKSAGLFDL